MPNSIGLALVLVGGLTAVYVGLVQGSAVLIGGKLTVFQGHPFVWWSQLSFVCLLLLPLAVGVFSNYPIVDILRDVIPHIFLFIPLFFFSRFVQMPSVWIQRFSLALSAVGVALAVRFLLIATPSLDVIGTGHYGYDEKLVLAADPAILFAAIYLPLMAADRLRSANLGDWFVSAMAIVGALTCLAAFGAKLARGPFFLSAFAYILYTLVTVKASFVRVVFIAVGGVVLFVLLKDPILGVVDLLIEKQLRVGDNAKIDEFRAVLISADTSLWTALFGRGWGALIDNPFRGTQFSFTHSIFSYYLAKAGVVGLALICMYLLLFIRPVMALWWNDRPLFFATIFGVLYPFLFQPTFKVMTTGLIMALALGAGVQSMGGGLSGNAVSKVQVKSFEKRDKNVQGECR